MALTACGEKDPGAVDAFTGGAIDVPPQQCQAQGAVGTFYRRTPNPRLVAGGHTFTDANVDTTITDPDLVWDEAGQLWHLYYTADHGTFGGVTGTLIRHATSTDLATWTFDDVPALGATGTEMVIGRPSVVIDPGGSVERRFLMAYAAATSDSPYDWSIRIAHSADGHGFARDATAITGLQVSSSSMRATASDPDLVIENGRYHMWFSGFACSGTGCANTDIHAIGHATSADGVTWAIQDAVVPSLLRAAADHATGGERPTVVYDAPHCKFEMWLTNESSPTENNDQPTEFENTSGLWHATSTNGMSWTINYAFTRDFVWDASSAGEHIGMMAGADIALKGTGRYMVYTGFDDQNVPASSQLPDRSGGGFRDGVMTLDLATRDAPP